MAIEKRVVAGIEIEWNTETGGPVATITEAAQKEFDDRQAEKEKRRAERAKLVAAATREAVKNFKSDDPQVAVPEPGYNTLAGVPQEGVTKAVAGQGTVVQQQSAAVPLATVPAPYPDEMAPIDPADTINPPTGTLLTPAAAREQGIKPARKRAAK